MARLTSDYLPLEGNSFFDMRGELPPAVRVSLDVPEDIQESITSKLVNLDDLRGALIDRYRPAAQFRLTKFRQDVSLGSISQVHRNADLGDGASVRYINFAGREQVALHFSEKLVRQVFEELQGELCMVVFHGANKVLAIPMSAVYAGNMSTPIYKATLDTSKGPSGEDWEQDRYYMTSQELLAAGQSVAFSEFAIDDKVKAAGPFAQGHVVTIGGVKSIEGYFDTIFNGSGDSKKLNIYTLNDKLSYTAKDGVKYEGPQPAPPADAYAEAVEKDGTPVYHTYDHSGVDSEGYGTVTYTSAIMSTKVGSGKSVKPAQPTTIKKVETDTKTKDNFGNSISQYMRGGEPVEGGGPCGGNSMPYLVTEVIGPLNRPNYRYSFEGELIYDGHSYIKEYAPGPKFWISTTTSVHGSYSLDVIFSENGGYRYETYATAGGGTRTLYGFGNGDTPAATSETPDVGHNYDIWNQSPNADNMVTTTFDASTREPGLSEWIAFYNDNFCAVHTFSRTVTYQSVPTQSVPVLSFTYSVNKTVVPYDFPHAVGDKIYKQVIDYGGQSSSHDPDCTIHTPYGVEPTIRLEYGRLSFYSWLNLHDSALLVQGSYYRRTSDTEEVPTFLLYFNGKKVTKIADVAVKDIRTIFISVPLASIKRWATKK